MEKEEKSVCVSVCVLRKDLPADSLLNSLPEVPQAVPNLAEGLRKSLAWELCHPI